MPVNVRVRPHSLSHYVHQCSGQRPRRCRYYLADLFPRRALVQLLEVDIKEVREQLRQGRGRQSNCWSVRNVKIDWTSVHERR